jgi:hypothetical protein
MRTCAPGNVAGEIVVKTAKDVAVVVSASLKPEQCPVFSRRYKVESTVEARIVGLGDINLGEKREEAVSVRLIAASPTVEVVAFNDLVSPASTIQLVDFVTVVRADKHVSEC